MIFPDSFEYHLIKINSVHHMGEACMPFSFKVRDTTQEPCGRLSFMKEPKSTRGLVHQAICNLNITLPIYAKVL